MVIAEKVPKGKDFLMITEHHLEIQGSKQMVQNY